MAADSRIRQDLYGRQRQLVAEELKVKLTKDSILQPGEYNQQPDQDRTKWTSITARDYGSEGLGKRDAPDWEVRASYQNKAHFEVKPEQEGVPQTTYSVSATHEDFQPKFVPKPEVKGQDNTIRWPDMAPQYLPSRKMGSTEYTDSFPKKRSQGPYYPRIDTSAIQQPSDVTEKTRKYRGVHLKLGDAKTGFESETGEAYNHMEEVAARSGQGSLAERMQHAKQVTKCMRDMEFTSNVFRGGDYNGAAQSMASTQCVDFNRRDHVGVIITPQAADGSFGPPPKPDMPGVIGSCLKTEVPNVYADATKGKVDQTSAHFFLGDEEGKHASVYDADFTPGAQAARTYAGKSKGPQGSEVLAKDATRKTGTSITNQEYGDLRLQMAPTVGNAEMKNLINNKLAKFKDYNFKLSYDQADGLPDRQVSLSHGDFLPPPGSFQKMVAMRACEPRYNYLNTDNALSYKRPYAQSTDNKTNFSGTLMDGESSLARRKMKDHVTKARLGDYLDTHFTIGYEPMRFESNYDSTFEGKQLESRQKAPAGVLSRKPGDEFDHLSITQNQQDITPDPFFMLKKNQVSRLDRQESRQTTLPVHKASIMKNDFQPLERRYMTQSQMNLLRYNKKLQNPATVPSHLFHTDTSGANNMRSISMDDFIQPERMMGPKLLKAL